MLKFTAFRNLIKGKEYFISLRLGVATVFVAILLTITLVIISLTTYRFSNELLDISDKFLSAVSSSVSRELSSHLNPTATASKLSAQLIEDGSLDPSDTEGMMNYTLDLLLVIPNAKMAYYGDQRGNFVIARRQDDGTFSNEVINTISSPMTRTFYYRDKNNKIIKQEPSNTFDYNPRQRPWYQAARTAGTSIWSNAYVFYTGTGNVLGVTSASPVYKNKKLLGVFGVDVEIDTISKFLAVQSVGKTGKAFIVDTNGNIIAFPKLSELLTQRNDGAQANLVNLINLKNPVYATAFTEFNKSGENKFTFTYDNTRYLTSFETIDEFSTHNWRIVTLVPENDFIGKIKNANKTTLFISMLILLTGLVLISILSKRLSVPIILLAQELQKIKYFHIDRKPAPKTLFKEVHIMNSAIDSMKIGLDAFRKYVPEKLIRQLITEGEAANIGGQKKEMTVFFSDIANFTTIAERLSADEIMEHLCTYFDEMTNIISKNEGTVDKYIGDAIMAFWGAPLVDEHHVEHACSAALDFQSRLTILNKQWTTAGKPEFPTRIGLHAGPVIVGNLGSSERLNYTVIGDSVNLASRLEQLNRVYGTDILVSEQIRETAKDQFLFRVIDSVVVKGRAESLFIYELICSKDNSIEQKTIDFCEEYSLAFMAYRNQAWDKAIAHFEKTLQLAPGDNASQIMIARCQRFKKEPPPSDWNGVWIFKSKSE